MEFEKTFEIVCDAPGCGKIAVAKVRFGDHPRDNLVLCRDCAKKLSAGLTALTEDGRKNGAKK